MEERKQRKPAPLHWIALGVLIVVGVVLAVVLLNGPLAESGDQEERALEKAKKECASLLHDGDYSGVAELYDSVDDYPQAQAEIKRQLKDHVVAAMMDCDAQRVPMIYQAFEETDPLFAVVMEGIRAGAAKLYKNSYADFMIFHQDLTAVNFLLEELDAYVMGYILEQLDAHDYTFAGNYIHILDHCETCVGELDRQLEERISGFLENGQYENVNLLYSQMRYWDRKEDVVGAMVLEHAYALVDQENYSDARYLLQILKDCKHPVYDMDAEFQYRLATMFIYVEEGKIGEAKKYARSFAGQTREKLLAALMEYTADGKVVGAMENAILNRMDMEAAGATWREILDKELELLRPYRNAYFIDDAMKQLVVDYMDAVDGQRKTLFWEQNAEAAAYWQQMEDRRLATLRILARDYGFGEGDERLQALLDQ